MFLNLGKRLPPTRVSPGGRVTGTVFLLPVREALWVTWHCPLLPGHLEMGGASSTHKAPGLCGTWNWGRSHLAIKDTCTLMRSQQKRRTPEWVQAPPPEAKVGCDILPISSKVGPVLHHSPAQQLFFLCDFNYREQEDKGLGGGQPLSSTRVSPHHTHQPTCSFSLGPLLPSPAWLSAHSPHSFGVPGPLLNPTRLIPDQKGSLLPSDTRKSLKKQICLQNTLLCTPAMHPRLGWEGVEGSEFQLSLSSCKILGT